MSETDHSKWGGPWTDLKLSVLFKYLDFFTKALRRKPRPDRPFNLVYIDVFAGSGYRVVKAEGETAGNAEEVTGENGVEALNEQDWRESDGSARLALEIAHPFSRVVFLDPFGMELEWDVLQAVARTESLDCWLLFPLATVQRLMNRDGIIPVGRRRRLTAFFGAEDWAQEFFQERDRQMTLWDSVESGHIKQASTAKVIAYTVRRLRAIFRQVLDHPLILRNRSRSPIFLLFFMMNNPRESAQRLAARVAKFIVERQGNDFEGALCGH